MASVIPWLDLLEPLTAPRHTPLEMREEDIPSPARADPQDLILEAEALLLSARAEAAELVEDAQIQAEALREAAWQEGYHQGQQEAQAALEAQLRAEWDARKQAIRTELDEIITQIITARQQLWQQQEPEMVALALDIARQVIKTEVTQNPEVVRAVITNAIRRITDKDNVRVRISVADAPQVKEMREDLMEIVDGLRHLEIIDDRRVGTGGCVIETNAGTIDAKVETQLAEVARALGVNANG